MRRRGRLAAAVLATTVALVAGACADSPPASERSLAGTNPFGMSEEDYLAGARAEQSVIRQCMEARGWPYTERNPDDLIVSPDERGAAWGIVGSALNPTHGGGYGPPADVQRSNHGAWQEQLISCSGDVFDDTDARRSAAAPAEQRLDRLWDEFRRSQEYRSAVAGWRTCMADAGYDVDDAERVADLIGARLFEMLEPVGMAPLELGHADLIALQNEEIALYETNARCRAVVIEPLEMIFKRELIREQANDIATIRQAVRGEG